MHISEGIISAPVLAAGAVFTAAGVSNGLRKLSYEKIPMVSVLCSAFFVAALIHVPFGPTSVHLVLNGLMGILLGWSVFPAMLIALFLQAVFFGFGGLTTLGLNTFNMAAPALLCYYLFRAFAKRTPVYLLGMFLGALAIALSACLVGASLFTCGRDFLTVSKLIIISHIPVMLIEGFITGSIIVFLAKVRPEILPAFQNKCGEGCYEK
jgi:cobalt/nickel transport system permease protein